MTKYKYEIIYLELCLLFSIIHANYFQGLYEKICFWYNSEDEWTQESYVYWKVFWLGYIFFLNYEVKETDLECPAWPVDSWVAKLKDLGGNHVPHPTKSGVGEPLKAAVVAVEAGEKTEVGADAG
ncbi:hypothetical protein Hanom_Chr17g01574931 [Helianthus anomalus]